MKSIILIILIPALILTALTTVALIRNDVPWKSEPGFLTRLARYTTTNIAETSDHAIFPELRTRTWNRPASDFFDDLIPLLISLDWEIRAADKDNLTIDAVVSSQLFGFKDDIHLRLEPAAKKQTRLHIHSASRTGSADFAANLGHILRLYQLIKIEHEYDVTQI